MADDMKDFLLKQGVTQTTLDILHKQQFFCINDLLLLEDEWSLKQLNLPLQQLLTLRHILKGLQPPRQSINHVERNPENYKLKSISTDGIPVHKGKKPRLNIPGHMVSTIPSTPPCDMYQEHSIPSPTSSLRSQCIGHSNRYNGRSHINKKKLRFDFNDQSDMATAHEPCDSPLLKPLESCLKISSSPVQVHLFTPRNTTRHIKIPNQDKSVAILFENPEDFGMKTSSALTYDNHEVTGRIEWDTVESSSAEEYSSDETTNESTGRISKYKSKVSNGVDSQFRCSLKSPGASSVDDYNTPSIPKDGHTKLENELAVNKSNALNPKDFVQPDVFFADFNDDAIDFTKQSNNVLPHFSTTRDSDYVAVAITTNPEIEFDQNHMNEQEQQTHKDNYIEVAKKIVSRVLTEAVNKLEMQENISSKSLQTNNPYFYEESSQAQSGNNIPSNYFGPENKSQALLHDFKLKSEQMPSTIHNVSIGNIYEDIQLIENESGTVDNASTDKIDQLQNDGIENIFQLLSSKNSYENLNDSHEILAINDLSSELDIDLDIVNTQNQLSENNSQFDSVSQMKKTFLFSENAYIDLHRNQKEDCPIFTLLSEDIDETFALSEDKQQEIDITPVTEIKETLEEIDNKREEISSTAHLNNDEPFVLNKNKQQEISCTSLNDDEETFILTDKKQCLEVSSFSHWDTDKAFVSSDKITPEISTKPKRKRQSKKKRRAIRRKSTIENVSDKAKDPCSENITLSGCDSDSHNNNRYTKKYKILSNVSFNLKYIPSYKCSLCPYGSTDNCLQYPTECPNITFDNGNYSIVTILSKSDQSFSTSCYKIPQFQNELINENNMCPYGADDRCLSCNNYCINSNYDHQFNVLFVPSTRSLSLPYNSSHKCQNAFLFCPYDFSTQCFQNTVNCPFKPQVSTIESILPQKPSMYAFVDISSIDLSYAEEFINPMLECPYGINEECVASCTQCSNAPSEDVNDITAFWIQSEPSLSVAYNDYKLNRLD